MVETPAGSSLAAVEDRADGKRASLYANYHNSNLLYFVQSRKVSLLQYDITQNRHILTTEIRTLSHHMCTYSQLYNQSNRFLSFSLTYTTASAASIWTSGPGKINTSKSAHRSFGQSLDKFLTSTTKQKEKVANGETIAGLSFFDNNEVGRNLFLVSQTYLTNDSGADDEDVEKSFFLGTSSNNNKFLRIATIPSDAALGFVALIINSDLITSIPDEQKNKLLIGEKTFTKADWPDDELKAALPHFADDEELIGVLLPTSIPVSYGEEVISGKFDEELMGVVSSARSILPETWYRLMGGCFHQDIHDLLMADGAKKWKALAAKGHAKEKSRGQIYSPHGRLNLEHVDNDTEASIHQKDIDGK